LGCRVGSRARAAGAAGARPRARQRRAGARQGADPPGRGGPDRRRRRRADRVRRRHPPRGRHAGARRDRVGAAPARARGTSRRRRSRGRGRLRHGCRRRQQGAPAQGHARTDDAEARRDHLRREGRRERHRAGAAGIARRRRHRSGQMSLASLVDRYGRAIVTVTIVLAAAGLYAAFELPSDIYPPLIFPRVVVIGHSGTIPAQSMMLTVTRPIEQALLEVPGIRRVRSTTFRGATEISAQFDPATDMILALQQAQGRIAEARSSLPQDLDLTIERLTPAAFPFLSVNLSGGLPSADLYDYAFYVMRPSLSRVPGVGNVEVLSSDTREIEVIADPARLTAAGLTIGN